MIGEEVKGGSAMRIAAATVGTLTCVLCVACAGPEPEPEPVTVEVTETRTVTETPPPVSADLRERVASLMVVGVKNYDEARAALEQGAGGLFIPSWSDPALLTQEGRNINALREEFDRPFSVGIDFEGGRVQRHADILGSFPPPRDLGQQSPEVIRGTGYDVGRTLAKYGIDVDYAPLLDVDAAGLDIVGDRAFGSSPERVAEVAVLFAQGLVDAGVTPTFKHFPGHGRASGDTHLTLAHTPPIQDLHAFDLAPYAAVLPKFPDASVMVGHMVVPGTGDQHTPSSLNPNTYRMLRTGDYPGGQPFNGVAITDDLSGMRAITDHMPTPVAVRRAIAAGADQALWSSGAGLRESIDTTVAAVNAGEIPVERIDDAARRVQQQLTHDRGNGPR